MTREGRADADSAFTDVEVLHRRVPVTPVDGGRVFADGHGGTWRHGSCQRRLRASLGETPLIECSSTDGSGGGVAAACLVVVVLLPQPATRATRQIRLTGNPMQYAAHRMRLTPRTSSSSPKCLA